MNVLKILGLICGLFLMALAMPVQAQYSMGVTGLLNIPTADMQPDGTCMAGGNFLPHAILPDTWKLRNSTGNYFVNLTFLPFVEVAYRCTLIHDKTDVGREWQQDRSVSLRLRPLKEGRWWPSVAIGSNDAFTTNTLNMFTEVKGNRFFSSVYGVATKHFGLGGHDIGVTVGGNIPFRKDSYKQGVFGGVSYSPGFCRLLTLMVEYDTTDAVNVGCSARLFNHLSLHAFCYDFRAVSGGVRYEFQLIKK